MKKLLSTLLIFSIMALFACTAAKGTLKDGQYSVEVTLSGGTGRASVSSPAQITLLNGEMTARIIWSSPNYDLMLVDGVKYLPVNTEGNSTFEIPIAALDQEITVSAETTAMSQPHVIDYTLRFDSATLRADDGGMIWIIAGAIVFVAVAVAVILCRRKKKVEYAA